MPAGGWEAGRGSQVCDRLCVCPCSAHALTADVSVAQTAAAAQLFLADAVVLTGTATGHPTDPRQLRGESWTPARGERGESRNSHCGLWFALV